jgi:protein-tyrosine phosphatase
MRTELYWIEGPWPGRLAIVPRPRGGDWLEDEVRAWKGAGIRVVVSTLVKNEETELDLLREEELCRANGTEYFTFPITDRGTPASAQATARLVRHLEEGLAGGESVAIHCRAGIGRSALLAACLLVASGLDAGTAFERVRAARGCPVPDTEEQRQWVERFARDLTTMAL